MPINLGITFAAIISRTMFSIYNNFSTIKKFYNIDSKTNKIINCIKILNCQQAITTKKFYYHYHILIFVSLRK